MEQYDNEYAEDNVYGHVVDIVSRFGPMDESIFLDFGCGYGRMAEVVRDRYKMRYVGLDINEPGLLSLKARGFETMFVDLRDPIAALALIDENLPGEQRIGALCIVDTLEHIAEPVKALLMLRVIAQRHCAPLIVSVPNVTHRDIGFKLATGMFDYTESGLLDYTHLQYFTEGRLEEMMGSAGLHQAFANDVILAKSDQHFPKEHAVLSEGASLHQLLVRLRTAVDHTGSINQFVRAYLPGPRLGDGTDVPWLSQKQPASPFLTVVTRTQGRRIDTLRETLLCLSAQTCQDFEVIVVGHNLEVEDQLAVERVLADLHQSMQSRVRLVREYGGGRAAPLNLGFEHAQGRYVAVLDDDDLVFGNWVESFRDLELNQSGQLLRLVAVAQRWDKVRSHHGLRASRAIGPMEALYPESFDLVAHIVQNRSPLHSLAFPRSVYRDLRMRFDDFLTTAEDWDFIIRVAPLTGVAVSTTVGCIYRQWKAEETSFTMHSDEEWRTNYFYSLRKIDSTPLLMPPGSVVSLRNMFLELTRLRATHGGLTYQASPLSVDSSPDVDQEYLEALRCHYHTLIVSKSWRLSSPLRWAKRVFRRQRRVKDEKIWQLSVPDLEYLIRNIESSNSWRKTRWMRNVQRILRN